MMPKPFASSVLARLATADAGGPIGPELPIVTGPIDALRS
jgi:hypothetical protein